MTKPLCVIQAPFATRSGYGEMSRDTIRQIMDLDMFDVRLVSTPWGSTPMNALDAENPVHVEMLECLATPTNPIDRKPDLFIQITIPSEYKPYGNYNIGLTAGIETNIASAEFLEGCNKMDLIWTTSEHSKTVLENSKMELKNKNTNEVVRTIRLDTPVEVIPNCVDPEIFKSIKESELEDTITEIMDPIEEDFCYLFVGNWLKGKIGEDRKNIGLLIKIFCETYKDDEDQPALILKTNGANFSILDRESILSKVERIRKSVGEGCPNVYVVHGDLTPQEMNSLYNHPKVKAHVSFTKGEGFGRPLLEASMSRKPVIASGWSGHMDFLNNKDAILLDGKLEKVDPSAVWEGVIVPEASWFNVDPEFASKALLYVRENYTNCMGKGKRTARNAKQNFSYEAVRDQVKDSLERNFPDPGEAPEIVDLNLPEGVEF